MILTDFKLPTYQLARCWIDELPDIGKLTSLTHTVKIDTANAIIARSRRVAIEWLVPIGFPMYGLLGGEMSAAAEGFTIKLATTDKPLANFEGNIASMTSDVVRCGLLEEYAQAVMNGMSAAANKIHTLPRATLICNIAACGMVGSSEMIFSALGKALVNLLVMSEEPNTKNVGEMLAKLNPQANQ